MVRTTGWRRSALLSVATLVIGTILGGFVVGSLKPNRVPSVGRFVITLPEDAQFTAAGRHLVALSPDGKHVVYQANSQLYLRPMGELDAVAIRGTAGGRSPFFSADGQWIGFHQAGQLKKVAITGGAPVKLCDAQNLWGVSWGAHDTILYGQGPGGIWRVSGQGGTPELLIGVDQTKSEQAHGPQLLPDGRSVLFTLATAILWDQAQIVVQSLDTGDRKVLLEGGRDAQYLSTGHLVQGVAPVRRAATTTRMGVSLRA